MDKKDQIEVDQSRLQFSSSNDMDPVASTGTSRSPFDCVNNSTYNCFKDEDYVHDTQVLKLHIAARDNHTNFIKRSLHKGVSVHLPDAVGRSALHWATVFCKSDTVEAIIKLFPVSRLDMGDRKGCTPLHYAVLAGRADVANMLLKAGCHVHSIDNQGRTPLHYAAQNANAAMLLLLVKRGADPSHLDKFKRSPYDVAKEYNNMEKILECLRLETSNICLGHEKTKPTEPRQKQPPMTTKVVQTDDRVSITFLSGNNKEEEASVLPDVLQTDEDEEVIRDIPVEIIKEEMERDAERMKYKLRKIEMQKKPPTQEKLKEQERALHLLLNRSKKHALEERRKRWAEEERLRWLTRNRTRSTTSRTCSIPQSFVGIKTPVESGIRSCQSPLRPSNASSPKREIEDLEPNVEDECREENNSPCKTSRLKVYPNSPPPSEIQTETDIVEKSYKRETIENNPQNADAAISYNQIAYDVKQARVEPNSDQESANASATDFPAYLDQWLTTTFSYPIVSHVSNLPTQFVPTNIPATSSGTTIALSEEQRNGTRSSSPPPSSPSPLLIDNDYFTAPSDVPSSGMDKTYPFSPQSTLSVSSYKSPTSPHSDACRPVSPRSKDTLEKNWAGQCDPATEMEKHVLQAADKSTSNLPQKNTKVQPEQEDEHPGSCASMSTKNTNRPNCARSQSGDDHSEPYSMLSPNHVSSESSPNKDEDPFPRLNDVRFFKSPKRSIDALPNRHGLECFSRPKAQSYKVRTSEDNKCQLNLPQSKHPWSPDEPWRPGGISKTMENFKMYGLLKAKRRSNYVQLIHAMNQSKSANKEEIGSDPFVETNSQEDDDIDMLPLAKVIRQQEALWSLRESSHQTLHHERSSICKPSSMVKNQDGRIISSPSTNNISLQNITQISTPHYPTNIATKTSSYLDTTTRTEEGQGMLIAQMTDEQYPQSYTKEASQKRQSYSFCYANPSKPSTSIPIYPRNSLEPTETSLQYASFIQQESQRGQSNQLSSSHPQRECCSASESTQNVPLSSCSTSFQLSQDNSLNFKNLSSATNYKNLESMANWPQQNSGYIAIGESQPIFNRKDKLMHEAPKSSKLEHSAYKESELRNRQQKERVQKSQSSYFIRRTNSSCSLSRTWYHGQSVRSQFLGVGRERPPVHQCIDVESLYRQWL